MNQNRLITPEGTRDLLFEDCISRIWWKAK